MHWTIDNLTDYTQYKAVTGLVLVIELFPPDLSSSGSQFLDVKSRLIFYENTETPKYPTGWNFLDNFACCL